MVQSKENQDLMKIAWDLLDMVLVIAKEQWTKVLVAICW